MSSTETRKKRGGDDLTRLRKFGFIMAAGLSALGGVFFWRGRGAGGWIIGAGVLFLLLGLVAPMVLRPMEKAWLRFGVAMSWIMTRVILTVTFYVVITPIGLVVRMLGKDTFGKRPDPSQNSYWVPVEQGGPMSRPDKPY